MSTSTPNFDPLNQLSPELRNKLNETINDPTHFLDIKNSVRAATTANITLSGLQTVDAVILKEGDRVLVKNQAAPANNGLYLASTGVWPRSSDASASESVETGLFTFVDEGAVNAQHGYVLNTANPIVLGTTPLNFTQFNGTGTITAGNGLTKTGDTLDVVANVDGSILANADDVQVGILATDAQHGLRGGGTQHANAVPAGLSGFMTGADKTKLDGVEALADVTDFANVSAALAAASADVAFNARKLTGVANPTLAQDAATKDYVDTQAAGEVPSARNLTAGSGLTGGGTLAADRTFDVVANADGSMVVNANDIQVGVLATDAQHGLRGGGTQHVDSTTLVSGFMSAADKTKLNGIEALADNTLAGTGLTKTGSTLDVIANADGSIVANANDIQVGVLATDAQHGLRGNGTQHTNAVAGTTAGFISGASQKKVDGLATNVTAVQISAYPAVIGDIVRSNPTAGGFTITLPAIAATNSGQRITVKNTSISTNAITIATTGADTVDSSATTSITASYGALDFISDGSGNWMVL